MPFSLLAIDPGIGSTGWAYWEVPNMGKVTPPTATGLIKERKHGEPLTWWGKADARACDLFHDIKILMRGDTDLLKVYCEMPIFFAGTPGGHAAAGNDSLQKLCFLVGTYGRSFRVAGAEFTPVKVADWKGQLPKEVVNKRIVNLLGEKECAGFRQDMWDAVGIGLYVKGVLNEIKRDAV